MSSACYSSFEEFAKIKQLIAMSLDQAPEDALEKGFELVGTAADVSVIETILGTIHNYLLQTGDQGGLRGMGMIYGVYLGEVIQKIHGKGKWNMHHRVAGEGSFPLSLVGHDIFPVGWCTKRIFNGPEDNVYHKYLASVLNRKSAGEGQAGS